MKFGGTSVGSAERIKNLAKIASENIHRNPIIVVSAFNGVTDHLINLAYNALKGDVNLDWIVNRHLKVMDELGISFDIVKEEFKELEVVLKGISYLKELNAKILDLVMSFGERISSKIIAEYLNDTGMNAKQFNAYDIGLITDSNFGNAEVLEQSYEIINKNLSNLRNCIPVITGFIGKDLKGRITTLGRGGSDYTATIIGAAVNAEEVQIWTDVDGVMTADPKVCPNARVIDALTYEEAYELAYFGAKVLHPKTLLPAKRKSIPIRILNSFNPSNKGTYIVANVERKRKVIAIVSKKNINVINIHTPKMFLAYGYLYKIFEVFNKHKISVDLISTSEVNVSLTFEDKYDVEDLIKDLKEIADVELYTSRASISLVGKEINQEPNIAGRAFSVLGEKGINIEMISAGSSKINISFVVNQELADLCVRELHEVFFENE
ncbi:MAG: aspartate kinase [Thermoproteota archaeon]|jgi:aspartate kinase|nr:aspartate kinase [Thermoproteota archaeon]